ncbi:MAG: hypothetical protein Q9163_004248 [Psora crenata]
MEDPDLIAILIPVDEDHYAENAFRRSENKNRCLPPTRRIDEGPAISSREPTPVYNLPQKDNSGNDYKDTHRLQLIFDSPPKDPTKGYAFGTDKLKCDVLLASRGVRGTSGVHFHITFDVINKERRLVLRDSSTNGTAVSYNGQAENEEIKVHVRRLQFKVKLVSHRTCEAEYKKNVGNFLNYSRTADPLLGGLSINSYTTEVAPSQSRTPGQRPVYIHEKELGKGSFGQVDRVIDVSTGVIYAYKTFYEPPWAKDKERRKCQLEKWRDKIRREIRIIMEHPHISSLKDEDFRNPLAEGETVHLLFQGLTVLEHLHLRGVAHRDLKPENILVESRFPLHLQFIDFGLANDQPDLKTFCGTEQYAAPELYIGRSYTTASLGVIVLEYVYGLPTQHLQAHTDGEAAMSERGLAWYRRLVEYATDWDSDPLIDLLTRGMLQIEARQRLSAGAYLRRAYELGLFGKPSASSGGTTPTRPIALASAVRNEEETPTVIAGPLWDAGRERSIQDDDDQGERSASDHHSVTSMSRQLGVPGSQSGKGAPRPRKGTPEAVSGRSSGHGRSSSGPPSPQEARSIIFRSKRHRSPAVSSPSNLSDESPVKRRPLESRLSHFRAPSASTIPLAPNHVGEVLSP